MISTARSRAIVQLARRAQFTARRGYAFSSNENKEINTAGAPKEVPNVSKSNEIPIDTPHQDASVKESVREGEKLRVQQAPNRAAIWSRSQTPRAKAMSGPRFEQTIMEFQVCNQIFGEKTILKIWTCGNNI
jgi:NADH dehydrogenase (ubiquinone) Fe-S protein 6